MKKVEMDNVEAIIEKEVDGIGRVSGLKRWKGRVVTVIIEKQE